MYHDRRVHYTSTMKAAHGEKESDQQWGIGDGNWRLETGTGDRHCGKLETTPSFLDFFLEFPSPQLELTNQPARSPSHPWSISLSWTHRFLPKWATHALTGHTLRRSRPSLLPSCPLFCRQQCLVSGHCPLSPSITRSDHQKIQHLQASPYLVAFE